MVSNILGTKKLNKYKINSHASTDDIIIENNNIKAKFKEYLESKCHTCQNKLKHL